MNRFLHTDKASETLTPVASIELPEALGEYDVKKVMQNLAGRNISASDAVCFLGGGVYDHFVPAVVNKLTEYAALYLNGNKSASECGGILKAVYELQGYLGELCGIKNVNTALCGMSDALKKTVKIAIANGKRCVAVARTLNPEYKKLIKTACFAYDIEFAELKADDGALMLSELDKINSDALVMVQSPNHFGIIEEMCDISAKTHQNGAMLAAITDPVSLAVLQTPGEYNADIAIGNGQPLGGAFNYGGDYFAYMALSDALAEYMPKGVVGFDNGSYTFDGEKEKAYRLLQAWQGAVYVSVMGTDGLKRVAETAISNAYCTFEKLTKTSAFKPAFNKPFFREFAVKATKKNVNDINNRMLDYGMIGGIMLKNEFPELGNTWLVAVTEKRSIDEIELFVKEASRNI